MGGGDCGKAEKEGERGGKEGNCVYKNVSWKIIITVEIVKIYALS